MTLEELRSHVDRLVVEAFGTAARVVRLAPLAGDASSRTYFRAAVDGARVSSSVVMVQPPGSGLSISSDELAVFDEAPKEMPFLNVQRYLASAGVAVPEVHAVDSPNGLVLLEDVGDTTLWDAAGAAGAGETADLYRAAIDELVEIQLAGARRPDPDCIAFHQRFDARLFLWEFDHFLEYGFAGRPRAESDVVELRRRFEDLADELAAEPAVLTHRDYHSWNLFVHEGRIRVIDFQDALLAPAPYDLATLLNDRATPRRVTPTLERALVEHFLHRRSDRIGADDDLDTFLGRYHRFVLQKSLKIVGRFHYLEEVKGRTGYVAMLPDTFATLRRCFAAAPGLEPIRALLARSFPEL